MPAELQAAEVLYRPSNLRAKRHRPRSRHRLVVRAERRAGVIVPAIPEVMEERVKPLQINTRGIVEAVVNRSCISVTRTVILIIALVEASEIERPRFDIVDAAS